MDLSEIEKFEAPAKVLKLSEAIRIGARMRPQARHGLFDGVGTCAMGAAAEALGWKPNMGDSNFDTLPEFVRHHPAYIWAGLRNDAGMTRERIADCLEEMGY